MEDLSLLKNNHLFDGLKENEIQALLICLQAVTAQYAKNTFLLRACEKTKRAGLLLSGRALILQEDFWGNRNLLAQLGPGQLFAETFACLPSSIVNVSVEAETPCVVLWLEIGRILSPCPTACAYHTRLNRNLVELLAQKNMNLNQKLTHVCQRSTREKLLAYLSEEARRSGSCEFDIGFNRQQLADYLCVERSAMSAALSRLREEGVLDCRKNHFVLHLPADGN